ncbi:MAG TPA: hypothetical protein DCL21_01415, partial [Alphaproteobacteria bacterium]|nr:hypothetical protein [Alphaproteobacteria bacterium]
YSISFVLIFILSIELLKYISATEMILVSRLNIIISLVFALVVLKRNTLEKGIWGLPLIILGLILVYSQIENSLYYVLGLGVLSSIAKSAYFFSIELNKTGYKTKNYLDDFGILGFILGVSALIALIFMLAGTTITTNMNIETRIFPTFNDYTNPTLFFLAGGYGLIGFTALRYLEFKSVQSIKSELFMCLITLVPLITLAFESCASFFGIIDSSVTITPPLLLANILIISGGILVVILKVLGQELTDEKDKKATLKTVRATEVFANHDRQKTADTLGIGLKKIEEILTQKNFSILKTEFKTIQDNFNKNVAMADHLTGLCNRLEFITSLKHIDTKSEASLFFIDLNKFKPVNDTHGHDAGDFILITVARRLENLFKSSVLTRMGGDEFCLLVRNANVENSEEMVKLIQDEIAKVYYYKGSEINISASAGFANYPQDAERPIDLLKIADEKMYNNKKDSDR